jgi:hypothetical protein
MTNEEEDDDDIDLPDTLPHSLTVYDHKELHQLQSIDQDMEHILKWIFTLFEPGVELVYFSGEVRVLLTKKSGWLVPKEELAISSATTKYYWSL